MSRTWSQKIEAKFALQLPADLRAWLDEQPWRLGGGAEFCMALTPERLLAPEPGTIWSGFMLPDTLPLVGNGYGDWLCVRVGPENEVTELIRWTHGGGDWIPYGRSLAEALVFDLVAFYTPIRHTVYEKPERPPERLDCLGRWARQWLAADTDPLFDAVANGDIESALERCLTARVAEFAVRRSRILRWLQSPLKAKSTTALAGQLGVSWDTDFVRWLFDTALIPEHHRHSLKHHFDCADDQLFRQSWDAAEQDAVAVTRCRADLGWAFDVAGWAAERRGALRDAQTRYQGGLAASVFSDETVAFRTHWYDEGYCKFAAARLAESRDQLTAQQRSDPYLNVLWQRDARTVRTRIRDYWMHQARDAADPRDAYRCFYRAGWDLGGNDMQAYREIFNGLVQSATAAGADALALVAKLHCQFL